MVYAAATTIVLDGKFGKLFVGVVVVVVLWSGRLVAAMVLAVVFETMVLLSGDVAAAVVRCGAVSRCVLVVVFVVGGCRGGVVVSVGCGV